MVDQVYSLCVLDDSNQFNWHTDPSITFSRYIKERSSLLKWNMAAIQQIIRLRGRERERQQRRPRSRLVRINAFVRTTMSPLDILEDSAILRKYQLRRTDIQLLLNLVEADLQRLTRRSYALNPATQLLAALRFYATGSFLEVLGDGHGSPRPQYRDPCRL